MCASIGKNSNGMMIGTVWVCVTNANGNGINLHFKNGVPARWSGSSDKGGRYIIGNRKGN